MILTCLMQSQNLVWSSDLALQQRWFQKKHIRTKENNQNLIPSWLDVSENWPKICSDTTCYEPSSHNHRNWTQECKSSLITIHFEGGNLQYTMLNIPKIIQEANMGVIYMKEVPRMCDKCYYKKKRFACMPSVIRRYMYAKCDESGRQSRWM